MNTALVKTYTQRRINHGKQINRNKTAGLFRRDVFV
jgi:hypothetical protein